MQTLLSANNIYRNGMRRFLYMERALEQPNTLAPFPSFMHTLGRYPGMFSLDSLTFEIRPMIVEPHLVLVLSLFLDKKS